MRIRFTGATVPAEMPVVDVDQWTAAEVFAKFFYLAENLPLSKRIVCQLIGDKAIIHIDSVQVAQATKVI